MNSRYLEDALAALALLVFAAAVTIAVMRCSQ